jgi:AcrR family transcriptional regulator
VAAPTREKIRDAERSRAAILAAAERLFASRGYGGASLSDIGAAAGLSRGAPSYFFGSKPALYGAVLEAAFDARQEATVQAFAPVRRWCEGGGAADLLEPALRQAALGYMDFLDRNPAFVVLITREQLEGGTRIGGTSRGSTAMRDAFAAVRRAGRHRGLGRFRVDDAVLVFVALTFAPISLRHTLMPAVGVDLATAAGRRRQARLAAAQLMHLLRGAG